MAPLTERELAALLALRQLPGIRDGRIRALVRRHGSLEAALAAPAAELGPEAAIERDARVVRERAARGVAVIAELGVRVLREGDAGYPLRLLDLPDPPYVLFARGDPDLLEGRCAAVIGSRRHTEYGADAARAIAGELAAAGLIVISGLARGIDGHAHRAALEVGRTVAVLGSGIDVAYPAEHRGLQERIAREGLLVTELSPGLAAFRHHFRARNRLIAALAEAVVVVEAGDRSGTLITVRHAIELNREVFAVPGPIGRSSSRGTNRLLQDGAHVLTDPSDVLFRLGIPLPAVRRPDAAAAPPAGGSAAALALWTALGPDPAHIDHVAAAAGLSPAAALAASLELELCGAARQLPGKRLARP